MAYVRRSVSKWNLIKPRSISCEVYYDIKGLLKTINDRSNFGKLLEIDYQYNEKHSVIDFKALIRIDLQDNGTIVHRYRILKIVTSSKSSSKSKYSDRYLPMIIDTADNIDEAILIYNRLIHSLNECNDIVGSTKVKPFYNIITNIDAIKKGTHDDEVHDEFLEFQKCLVNIRGDEYK